MRGADIQQDGLFSTVSPEQRVPKDHPLRPIRQMADEALAALDGDFDALYAGLGRDSIPPEKLLRAQLLMVLYSIRSERQLMEQLDYNLLFRWFVGFSMDDKVWHHSTFTKNRDRLLEGEVAHRFFAQVLKQARGADLLSREHFSVDGTLIEALASLKSYRPKDEDEPPTQGGGRNPSVDFRGERRTRDTHASKTDPQAFLFRKSQGTTAKLSYMGHLLMENRHGLVVDARVSQATGRAEREVGAEMVEALTGTHRVTVGADKNYDTRGFVRRLREANATPHVAQNDTRRTSAIDGRTTAHPGYRSSQTIRKRIEECFGWAKTIGGLRKSRFVGPEKLDFQFVLTMAAYNLVRMRNLGVAAC
ncbi:transposase [Acidihalobacter yilgarnensis]|uniref:Transposase n=1 Tax=Acidihalobacter yilgarnensis TaxID=2819280 RepID=A0A1D8IKT1_9GAMM|nr:IS5 family transposase [Acidihalobacter yilgarnensis]AOU96796.1 transposase [Acidihalobacter yilgarnensis]AOU97076.1 transposase [Acidihalobacter yilgarnensis]AOU98191.1 transposase [Acidihalobacter yilgarnensis]AOU99139.1 transposase [Acidihalobacter yilgarnensis]